MLRNPDRIVRAAVRSRYLVTLADGEALEGVLLDADAKTIVLTDVHQVAATGARAGVAGNVLVPRSTVKYLQNIQG